jgi:hypothetical protein
MAFKRSWLALFFVGVIATPAWAQAPTQDTRYRPIIFNNTDGVTTSFVSAPVFSSGTSTGVVNASQWLKVELHYSVTPKPTSAGGNFLSNATFRIWIEGRDLYDPQGKPGEGIAVVLTGSVTYLNIAAGRDAYASFYVHPATLARYSTSNGYTDFDRAFNIHVEADVDGQISDYYDKRPEQDLNWYTKPSAIDGLVYRQNQCAFIVDAAGRYPPIKLDDSSSSSGPAVAPQPLPPAAPPAPTQ